MTGPVRPRLFLTAQQGAVLQELCADGASTAEIAARLNITTHTVKSHIKNILRAASCADRTELVVRVLRGQFVVCVGHVGTARRAA